MTTILIKKKDTAGAPAAGDLTNAAGGAEIAVNTATKRLYTKDSGGTVVELGTNPSALTTNLLFSPDATYDIGASGASRPRDIFMSRNLTVGGTLVVTGGINFNGNVTVGDSSSDTLTINSTVTSNLLFTDATYNIGGASNRVNNGYFASNLFVSGGTLNIINLARGTTSNGWDNALANGVVDGPDGALWLRSASSGLDLVTNAYYTGAVWTRKNLGSVGRFSINGQDIVYSYIGSGAAGSTFVTGALTTGWGFSGTNAALYVGSVSTVSGGGLLQIGQVANGTSSSIGFNNNDNAVISSKYSQIYQVDSTGAVGSRGFTWRYGGYGYTDGTGLMYLNTNAQLGLMLNPSLAAWRSINKVMQLGLSAWISGYDSTNRTEVGQNWYYDSASQPRYINSGYAQSIQMNEDGYMYFGQTKTTGSAASAASVGTTFYLSPTGAFTVGRNDAGGNASANTYSRFQGVGLYDGTAYYGNYGGFYINSTANYSASARRFLFTNAYNATNFAIIRSTDATTDPTLGSLGTISSGYADFNITETGLVTVSSSNTRNYVKTYSKFNVIVNGSAQDAISVQNFNSSGNMVALGFWKDDGTNVAYINQSQTGVDYYTTASSSTGPVLTKSGLQFPASSIAAGNANILDDYEEGTCNLAYATDGTNFTSVTYQYYTARYVKVGKLVTLTGLLRTTDITKGSATGNVIITGLPFTSSPTSGTNYNRSAPALVNSYVNDGSTVRTITGMQNNPSTTTLEMYYNNGSSNWVLVTVAQVGGGAINFGIDNVITITYQTDL